MTLSANLDDFCFADTETRSVTGTPSPFDDVTEVGTYAYAPNAIVVILTYAIGAGPVREVAMDEGFDEEGFRWDALPDDLRRFWDRAERGQSWFTFWNTQFDRTLLYSGTADLPKLRADMCIDCMAQAVASNLPPSLEGALRTLTKSGKQEDGKELIRLFSKWQGPQPYDRPVEWGRYKSYARRDVGGLREVYQGTRPLSRETWEEYWASEQINERGFTIDAGLARRCAAISELSQARMNRRIAQLTGKTVTKVTQAARIANWVYDRLEHSAARELLVKVYDEDSEDELKPAKLGLDRARIEALLAFLDALEEKQDGLTEIDIAIAELLELRQWGGSATPGKFAKMLIQKDHADRLRGSYVFNGAQQTGRFSSRGVQVHNLTRSHIGMRDKAPWGEADDTLELQAINDIMELDL